jgi:hypothetical protein
MSDTIATLAELLADCETLGIRLFPSGDGGLTVDAPRSTLMPELTARLKAHKAARLHWLCATPLAEFGNSSVSPVSPAAAKAATSGKSGRCALSVGRPQFFPAKSVCGAAFPAKCRSAIR